MGNSGIDSLIRCAVVSTAGNMGESQEIGLVPFVVVHGCFWGMFCNSGLIQEYPIRFNLDRRTSSHYAPLFGDIHLLQGLSLWFTSTLLGSFQHTALIIERFL